MRQFVVKKQVFFPFNYRYCHNGSKVRCAIQLEICGIGEVWVNCKPTCYSLGELPFDCFKTIEDYKMGNPYEVNYITITASHLATIFLKRGICNFTKTFASYRASLYQWDGVTCVRCDVNRNISLCVIWEGYLNVPFEKAQHPYYISEEEYAENNSLKVECFADYDNKESEVEEETIVNLSFKVKSENVQKIMNFVDSL